MAYPTGSGTEILRRGGINALSDSQTAFRFDGTSSTTGTNNYTVPANHIITVLNVIVNEQGGAAETFNLSVNDGTINIVLLQSQAIGIYETFIFDEKIVLLGGDYMQMVVGSAGNVDVWYSYIDQDWS
tara:strand:+ start:64 stop:447 length:384 start_codon:yes stop_codon:yes gene_type:complete